MSATRLVDLGSPNFPPERRAICAIIVAHQIGRRRLPRKGLDNLLRQPLRRRMSGHRKPKKLTPSVADNDEREEALEVHAWNHAQVNRSDRLRMVTQERPPALQGRMSPSDHRLGHRQLDAALQLVIDGAQPEIVLEVLEGGFDLGELDVELPQLSRLAPAQIGAQQVAPFASPRLAQLFAMNV